MPAHIFLMNIRHDEIPLFTICGCSKPLSLHPTPRALKPGGLVSFDQIRTVNRQPYPLIPHSSNPISNPQTPNPKPQTPIPNHQSPIPKPRTPNPSPQTPNPKSQTLNPKPQTLNLKPQTPNPKPQPSQRTRSKRVQRWNGPRCTRVKARGYRLRVEDVD